MKAYWNTMTNEQGEALLDKLVEDDIQPFQQNCSLHSMSETYMFEDCLYRITVWVGQETSWTFEKWHIEG